MTYESVITNGDLNYDFAVRILTAITHYRKIRIQHTVTAVYIYAPQLYAYKPTTNGLLQKGNAKYATDPCERNAWTSSAASTGGGAAARAARVARARLVGGGSGSGAA